nr:hypothetical protein GCM10010200_043180 [Actinomadura rugatobispora]
MRRNLAPAYDTRAPISAIVETLAARTRRPRGGRGNTDDMGTKQTVSTT